jgi:hypothetical protein
MKGFKFKIPRTNFKLPSHRSVLKMAVGSWKLGKKKSTSNRNPMNDASFDRHTDGDAGGGRE